MKKELLLVAIAVSGLLAGVGIGSFDDGSEYCSSIEQDVKQDQNFTGSFACYPPGELDANVSDRVEENSEVRCVCRIIDDSGIRLYPIAVSN